jgi:putative endonuclease
MVLVARDVRLRQGQIDLVMLDGDCLVVVEVKARSGPAYGLPQEAVGWRKLKKLKELTELFHQMYPGVGRSRRIDVVAVELDRSGRPARCEHIPNVLA